MSELVILVGLPGAGKSTFYRERFAATHVHVSKDLIPRSTDKSRRQRALIEEALIEGRSVVVDNTSMSRAERAAIIEVGQKFGAGVVVYRFDESIADCWERNVLREGAACVPYVALRVADERYDAPSLAEGIDAIHVVRLGDGGLHPRRMSPPSPRSTR